jgi:hypothetical protein
LSKHTLSRALAVSAISTTAVSMKNFLVITSLLFYCFTFTPKYAFACKVTNNSRKNTITTRKKTFAFLVSSHKSITFATCFLEITFQNAQPAAGTTPVSATAAPLPLHPQSNHKFQSSKITLPHEVQ